MLAVTIKRWNVDRTGFRTSAPNMDQSCVQFKCKRSSSCRSSSFDSLSWAGYWARAPSALPEGWIIGMTVAPRQEKRLPTRSGRCKSLGLLLANCCWQ